MDLSGAVEFSTFDVAVIIFASALSILAVPAVVFGLFLLWRRTRSDEPPEPLSEWVARRRPRILIALVAILVLLVVFGVTQSGTSIGGN